MTETCPAARRVPSCACLVDGRVLHDEDCPTIADQPERSCVGCGRPYTAGRACQVGGDCEAEL